MLKAEARGAERYKTPASSFFHEEARSLGILILTHILNGEVTPISNVSRRRRSIPL